MNVYVVLLIQILLASATHIVAKVVVADLNPLALTFFRGVISAAGLAFIVALRGRWVRLERADRNRLIFLGGLSALNQYLYLLGLRYSTAANGALLYASTPIFVLFLSHWSGQERITPKKAVGIALAFAGVAVIIFERGIRFASDTTLGNLTILAAVVCWALYTVLGKDLVLKYGALQATSGANFAGLLLLTPFGLAASPDVPFKTLTMMDWAGVTYLGIGTSVIAYLLWYYALRRIDASRLAVFANGQPIVATLLSVIFLSAVITNQFIGGACMTLAGVALTQMRSPAGTFRRRRLSNDH